MVVEIEHIGEINFLAKTSKTSFEIKPKEISPLEYFLAGMIACSGYDVVVLPKKQGFEVKNFKLKVEALRKDTPPYKFDAFHLIYSFESTADEIKAHRWVLSSLQSYCTTLNTVRDSAKIIYSIIYNGQMIADKEEIDSGSNKKAFDFEAAKSESGACGV